ncbi:formate/nitrite transporter family protein [Mycoplasma sp. P36-A1]|uniref:formate/nitrite transporter family protein n=1 Tax=Mycoplasma sp. P36-A1 TaxID=3252900 RepID=UPI003C2DE40E
MYNLLIEDVNKAAANKMKSGLKKPLNYFVASMLAGFFVGLGILLIFSISGQLGNTPYTKLIMGVSFGVALSLVIMAGSELFTGNNFVLGVSLFDKKAKLMDVIKLWVLCYLGNLAGAALLSIIFILAGLGQIGDGVASNGVGMAIQNAASAKMNGDFIQLFFKGVLCNVLVCLAVLCSIKLKSESGKLIMIWWCLFAFITTGFEHSVANMTIFFTSLFTPHIETVSYSGMIYNLLATTSGNIVGGLLLAGAYIVASRNMDK